MAIYAIDQPPPKIGFLSDVSFWWIVLTDADDLFCRCLLGTGAWSLHFPASSSNRFSRVAVWVAAHVLVFWCLFKSSYPTKTVGLLNLHFVVFCFMTLMGSYHQFWSILSSLHSHGTWMYMVHHGHHSCCQGQCFAFETCKVIGQGIGLDPLETLDLIW